jgi:hypothetical protein
MSPVRSSLQGMRKFAKESGWRIFSSSCRLGLKGGDVPSFSLGVCSQGRSRSITTRGPVRAVASPQLILSAWTIISASSSSPSSRSNGDDVFSSATAATRFLTRRAAPLRSLSKTGPLNIVPGAGSLSILTSSSAPIVEKNFLKSYERRSDGR